MLTSVQTGLLRLSETMRVSRRDNLNRYYVWQGFGFGLFIHYIHHDEEPDVFHSHPWDGISFLFGSYLEERFGEAPILRRFLNVIHATRHHRVSLPNGPVWSVFVHGRRRESHRWSVKNRAGVIFDIEPWRGVGGRRSYKPDNDA
jgi:hypothetical protein